MPKAAKSEFTYSKTSYLFHEHKKEKAGMPRLFYESAGDPPSY